MSTLGRWISQQLPRVKVWSTVGYNAIIITDKIRNLLKHYITL